MVGIAGLTYSVELALLFFDCPKKSNQRKDTTNKAPSPSTSQNDQDPRRRRTVRGHPRAMIHNFRSKSDSGERPEPTAGQARALRGEALLVLDFFADFLYQDRKVRAPAA